MKIIRAKDYAEMSRKAANIISAQVIMKPDCVLGLATGGTPVGAYEVLVERYNARDLDFSEVTTVNLDAEAECKRYDEIIRSVGGVDLQLLGIGHDGHIGFNEPSEAFDLGTHCVDLTQETIEANKRFFDGNVDLVPKQAYTMGIRTIMQARKVLMVVNGAAKAEIVKKAFFGPVTPEVPASILQMHPDFILVGDEEALSLL